MLAVYMLSRPTMQTWPSVAYLANLSAAVLPGARASYSDAPAELTSCKERTSGARRLYDTQGVLYAVWHPEESNRDCTCLANGAERQQFRLSPKSCKLADDAGSLTRFRNLMPLCLHTAIRCSRGCGAAAAKPIAAYFVCFDNEPATRLPLEANEQSSRWTAGWGWGWGWGFHIIIGRPQTSSVSACWQVL